MIVARLRLGRSIVLLACAAACGCGREQTPLAESVWQWPEEEAAAPGAWSQPEAAPRAVETSMDADAADSGGPSTSEIDDSVAAKASIPAAAAAFRAGSTQEAESLDWLAPKDGPLDAPEDELEFSIPVPDEQTTAAQRAVDAASLVRRADRYIRHGFELARRGAGFAARSQLLLGLQTIAESRDHLHATTQHTEALESAWTAVREARDFLPGARPVGPDVVNRIAKVHSSPVLSPRQRQQYSPLQAAQAYYGFARDQFADAFGGEPLASLALHGLGKLQPLLAAADASAEKDVEPEAAVYFASAVATDPNNFLAANELGVQYAKLGRFDEAEQALREAAQRGRVASIWRNLAKVYEYRRDLASARQAHLAAAELELAARSPTAPPGWSADANWVRWTTPDEFEGRGGGSAVAQSPRPTPADLTPAQQTTSQTTTAGRTPPNHPMEHLSRLLPWKRGSGLR